MRMIATGLATLIVGISTSAFAGGDAVKGKAAFAINCSPCHGPGGVGDGPAAVALNPKPRNLTKDPLKAGDKEDQILATITKGLPGTAMAGFAHLPEDTRKDLTAFVLTLRPKK